ncbi:hypothetical protein J2T21_001561 [Paeniglutamicibacter psychrophenolicus]|nr:hypothetical protein [Paeniglutamicibacter psychrophenolicus]
MVEDRPTLKAGPRSWQDHAPAAREQFRYRTRR